MVDNNPRGFTELSRAVADMLKADVNEDNRFKSMDLCTEVMDRCDVTHDQLMRDTLRSWIGKIQDRFQT